jgi:peptide/nickel transport system substrate-binding protein
MRFATLVLLGFVSACGGQAETAATAAGATAAGVPRYGGTLVIGANTDVGDISPLTFRVQNALYLQQFVLFLPLIAYDEQLAPVPRLARSWDFSEDTTSITFHLRDDVYWQDGVRTSAHDVDFSYTLARDPRTAYIYAGMWRYYRGSEVIDSFTWRVELEPHSGFLDIWRTFAPVPAHVLRGVAPDALARHPFGTTTPVGNGPFRFVERAPGERWVFEANPRFPEELGGRPWVDRLIYRTIPEHGSLLTELLTGGIDFYARLLVEHAGRVTGSPGARVIATPDRSWTHVVWNHRRPPFDDVRVRRALTHAIDREALVGVARAGYGAVANSSIAPVFPQHDPAAGAELVHDPDRARALLAEAGFADRNGDGILQDERGRPFRFTLLVPHGYPERHAAATVIQSDLRRVGVDARLRTVEFNVLLAQTSDPRRRDFDAMIIAWKPEFRIDDSELFGCDSRAAPAAFTGYCDAGTDALLDSIARTADPAAARPLWSRYQHRIADHQPVTFLYFIEELHGAGPRLRDARPDARGDWAGVERWWLDQGRS